MSTPQPPMAGRPSPLIKSSPAPSSATATPNPQTLGPPKPPPTLQQLQQQQLRAQQQQQIQAQNAQQQPQSQNQNHHQQQPQHPPMKHPQSSLNTLPSMFHAVLIQTADVFATPAATHPRAIPFSSKRLSIAVTTATERFHFGLDQLEMDIVRAKEVLRRDLSILQEKRRKEEEREKEKVRAREEELQKEAEERLRLMEEARKERDTTRPQQQSQSQLKLVTQQGNEQGKMVDLDDDDVEMVGNSTTGGKMDMKDDDDIVMLDSDPSIQQQQQPEQTQQHGPSQQDSEQDHPMDDDMDYLFGTDDSAPPSATVLNPPQHQDLPQAQLEQHHTQPQQQQQSHPQPSSDFDNFLATVPNVIGDTGGGEGDHGSNNTGANSSYNQDSFSDLFDYAQ